MGVVYKLLHTTLSVISYFVMLVVDQLFALYYKNNQMSVSKVADPLLLMPATTLANKIRKKELNAEDVMASYIARAKEVNHVVNAIVGEQYDRALRTAQDLDAALASLSPEQIEKDPQFSAESKPLLGVPLSVKEAFMWTGMTNTSGVVSRKHIRSSHDAPVLSQLKAAGAIPFIQSNVSEACMWFESSNYVYGCTNNAYNTSRMVGGSSGGEGCVISAGASVIGIGSDIGGSIRMPCFFNGIFGHKPSPGVVDNSGQFPSASEKASSLLATGPMCRYAGDLIPALKVMAKPSELVKLKLDAEVDLTKLRVISIPDDCGGLMISNVDPELKEAQKKIVDHLRTLGVSVSEQRVSKFRLALDMWAGSMNLCDDGPVFSEIIAGQLEDGKRVNCVLELFLSLFRRSQHTLPAIMLGIYDDFIPRHTKSVDARAKGILDTLRVELLELLGPDGILLYPSHPKMSPYHSHPMFTPFNFAYTALFNALGFPVTQCPLGLSREGLPLGVQVVAAPHNDHLSLAMAGVLEKAFGGWVSPGGRESS